MKLEASALEKHLNYSDSSFKNFAKQLKHLGIVDFSFCENHMDGSGVLLTSKPEYALASVKGNVHRNWLSLQHPKKLGNMFCAMSTNYSDIETAEIQKTFGYERNGVFIIQKHSDVARMYFFQSPVENEEFLIAQRNTLDDFITYFHDKCSMLLKKARQKRFEITENPLLAHSEKLPPLNLGNNIFPDSKRITNSITFPPQQQACLKLLASGYTPKNIADELNISIRTVYFYFQVIKKKTGMSTLVQLAKIESAQ